jgi:hypothetical protein
MSGLAHRLLYGLAPQVRSLRARFNARLQIRHDARFRGSVPLAIFVSLLDKVIVRFLSTLRVAGTKHMLLARYDMMVAQPGAVKKP